MKNYDGILSGQWNLVAARNALFAENIHIELDQFTVMGAHFYEGFIHEVRSLHKHNEHLHSRDIEYISALHACAVHRQKTALTDSKQFMNKREELQKISQQWEKMVFLEGFDPQKICKAIDGNRTRSVDFYDGACHAHTLLNHLDTAWSSHQGENYPNATYCYVAWQLCNNT